MLCWHGISWTALKARLLVCWPCPAFNAKLQDRRDPDPRATRKSSSSTRASDDSTPTDNETYSAKACSLAHFFDQYQWETLITCRLVVSPDSGAGLVLEETRWGF